MVYLSNPQYRDAEIAFWATPDEFDRIPKASVRTQQVQGDFSLFVLPRTKANEVALRICGMNTDWASCTNNPLLGTHKP